MSRSLALRPLPMLFSVLAAAALSASTGYLSMPDIHGDTIVFSAEGDLWTVPAHGGTARRITSHPGREYFARYSPDGERIAFTGEYDGNRDVFVIPASGGEPRRLTWHPDSDEVIGWTPDGSSVIFRSRREHPHGSWELFTVPAGGGDVEKIPLGWAARLSIEPGTGRYAFNRISRETRTWKRYRGGTAQQIWVGDPDKADYRQITTFAGTDAFPMWHGGRIWFASDEGGTMNLWSMRPDGSDRRRHTEFDEWDVRWPAMGPDGRIVFNLGADIHVFDPATGSSRRLEVDVPSDRILTRVRYPQAERYLTSFDLSPDATRLAVVSRGEIFSVPAKEGLTLRLTGGSAAREKDVHYGPEGDKVVFISDQTGEESIRVLDAWGRGEASTIKGAVEGGWHFPPVWSPDGKWIAYADQTQTLFVLSARGGSPKAVDRSDQEEIRQYRWSPDGRWLAYAKTSRTDFSSIYVYDTRKATVHRITGETTNDTSPAWDPDGRYLYFLSSRTMNPFIGWSDFETVELLSTKPYMVLLRRDVENPFAHLHGMPDRKEGGEERNGKKEKEDGKNGRDEKSSGRGKAGKGGPSPSPVAIDFDGIEDRVVGIPVKAGRYGALDASSGKVFYLSFPLQGLAEEPEWWQEDTGPRNDLMAFDLEDKKAAPFVKGVDSYVLAAGAGKLAFMKNRGDIYVVDAGNPPGDDLSDSKVSLEDVVLELDPREEWRQIYYEAWRHMRDFVWDPGMAGVDWKAVRDQYATLLPRLSSREDLRDLLGELIGELATSHTYVWGGDYGVQVSRVSTGLLGADLVRDGDGYRVAKIYRGDPADNERSPLEEPQAHVREGDVILAVNNQGFPPDRPFYASLQDLAGKEVLLTVSDGGAPGRTRQAVVVPMSSDRSLRYSDWVRRNREYVAEKTGGEIGYIHIPDMGKDGMVEFDTWFYSQLDKQGMVVDVRWNGGGFVSQLILERFRRHVLSFDRARGGGIETYPYRTLNGPFVVITNQFAGSDGDIFPAAVQLEGLAPVIGKRSWGGVIGIRADKRLVDQGALTQPEFAWWDPKQGWGIENRGVIPDIEIENPPQALARGEDPQLDKAIEVVLQRREEHPPVEPKFGPVPDKSRKAFEKELRRR